MKVVLVAFTGVWKDTGFLNWSVSIDQNQTVEVTGSAHMHLSHYTWVATGHIMHITAKIPKTYIDFRYVYVIVLSFANRSINV